MSTIVTRAGKGSPLTHTEADANFTNLNTDKLESASLASTASTSLGDFLVGVKRTVTNAVATTQHAWHESQRYNVKTDFGATGNGVADDTTAIQNAINAAGAGTEIYFPEGTYKITSTLTVAENRVNLVGAGRHATVIYFVPSANDICLDLTAGASVLAQGSVRDMLFYADSSSHTKIAIQLQDATGYLLENIAIGGETIVPGVGSFWGGTNSIGLKLKSREALNVNGFYCYADRPLLISTNSNGGTIDADHFHFSDLYLVANANPNVEIETGVKLTQVVFDGYQAWVKGNTGLKWVDSTTSGVANGLTLRNVRIEGGTDTSAYNIDIQHNTNLQNLRIENCYFEGGRNGIKLRKCVDPVLSDSCYVGTTGRTSLNIDSTVSRLELRKMFWQSGSTHSITGQKIIWSPNHPSSTLPPSYALYNSTTEYGPGNFIFQGAFGGETFTLSNNATAQAAPANSMGFLFVQDSEGLGAIFYLRGANNAVDEVADPATVFSTTATTGSSTNVYWSGGNNRYEIENKRGASRSYRVTLMGSYSSAF